MEILPRGVAATYLSGTATGIFGSLFLLYLPEHAVAQGLPVETGSHLPVALWLGGAVVLGIAIAYEIYAPQPHQRGKANDRSGDKRPLCEREPRRQLARLGQLANRVG